MEIDRIVLEGLVHFKEENNEESASSYYLNESSESKEIKEKRDLKTIFLIVILKNSNEDR